MNNKSLALDQLELFGLTEAEYEACLQDILDKQSGINDMDWSEIVDKYNLNIHADTLRKASSTIFGGAFVSTYFKNKTKTVQEQVNDLNKESELKKERYKIRTEQILLNKIYRENSRIELFYSNIKDTIEELPRPELERFHVEDNNMEYVLTIADIHAGACFTSMNNEYGLEIVRERFNNMLSQTVKFVQDKHLDKLKVIIMGDEIQGMLRLTDISLNEVAVVEAVVFVSKIISEFLNELSAYCDVDCYYVPYSNHNQTRPIGTKANELVREDMTYIIANYIKDVLANNKHVVINYDSSKDYVDIDLFGFNVIAMHGHQMKNAESAIRNLALVHRKIYDYIFLAHFHASKEFVVGEGEHNDIEVLVVPSFIGSDPYSDKLLLGAKASCKIYGFDDESGHVETYKFILN